MRAGDLTHPSARTRRRWLLGVAILVALAGVLVYLIYGQILKYELLSADGESVAATPRLAHFAEDMARPAWTDNCAGCHGADLKGNSNRGIPDLTDGDWLYGSGKIAQIEYTITYGIRSGNPKARNLAFMPSFAHPNDDKEKLSPLSPAEIKDVIAYIFSLEGRKADPGAVERGAALYADKGACYDCHTPDARGDHDIGAPNLADNIWLYGDGSEAAVFKSIERGRAGTCPAWIGRLTPAVIRALAVFIQDHSQTKIARNP
jgi:cbb3-type cytochrome c oxidase subunit III